MLGRDELLGEDQTGFLRLSDEMFLDTTHGFVVHLVFSLVDPNT